MSLDNEFIELCHELNDIVQRRIAYLVTFNGIGRHSIFDITAKELVDVSFNSRLARMQFPSEFGTEVDQLVELPFDVSTYWFANISTEEYNVYIALCKSHAPTEQDALTLYYKLRWLAQRFISEKLIARIRKANMWIESEFEDIAKIQSNLLPNANNKINGIDYAYLYQAMNGAGGDYIDIVNFTQHPEKPDDFGVIVADVAGHGAAASVEAAMVDAILRTYRPADPTHGPSEVLNYINTHFFTRKERGRFITINIFRYFAESETLLYANAGHPPAYIVRGDELIVLDNGGIPLGVMREATWDSYTCKIEPGDLIFVYTDAVVEAKNIDNDIFDFDKLETLLYQENGSPRALIDRVFHSLMSHTQSDQFDDDLTLCAIRFN
ncbi:PP2C family protein-serine/threonine phosphatase [Thalassotalea euphylliae]|uniref:PP2C family protein-serine/threonine phosphatase n=1 Tax=Thalassotalea euphylliae TaxID=1655234 RepID=UPI003642E7B3